MKPRTGLAAAAAVPVVVGALLACVRMTSFDLPLAVAGGDRLLATGAIPTTNPWNWAHPGFPWLDDKWGFGLLCAAAERLGGGIGLSVLNMVLGALAGWLVFALARRRSAPWTAAYVALAAVTMLSYRAMLRAEWISYLGVGWTLLHLDGIVAGSWKRAALVAAVVPLWAACHVYWLLAPALILVASVAALSWRGTVAGLAAFAAAAVSPYGVANLAHPFRIAEGASRLEGAITELRAPFVSGGPITYFHVLAILLAVGVLVRVPLILAPATTWSPDAEARGLRLFGRGLRFSLAAAGSWERATALVCGALLVVAFRYDRNLPFVALAFAFTSPQEREDAPPRAACWPGCFAVPAVAGLLAGIPWLAPERTFGLGWDEDVQPFRLVASLGPETRAQRWINDFSIGSFLDWKHGASFIDGNSHGYPIEHFERYRQALEGSVTVAEMDARFPNDGWFLRTSAPHTRVLVVGLFLEGDYAPVDADDVATLFRKVEDPEKADALWHAWLAERYLPVARTWFGSRDDVLAAAGGAEPAADDAAAWLRLVIASPWERSFLDGLQKAYDLRGERIPAARIWRLARRM